MTQVLESACKDLKAAILPMLKDVAANMLGFLGGGGRNYIKKKKKIQEAKNTMSEIKKIHWMDLTTGWSGRKSQ